MFEAIIHCPDLRVPSLAPKPVRLQLDVRRRAGGGSSRQVRRGETGRLLRSS